MSTKRIKSALVSVFYKDGLDEIIKMLHAEVSCWPDYPADQLAVACGRCSQWAERGAEAGREAYPPASYRWSVVTRALFCLALTQ